MRNTIRLKILFLVGMFVFIGRNAFAYTWISWPRPLTPELIILRNILAVICIVLVLIAIKAKKDGDEDLKKGKDFDESVQNFKKHEQEKPKE